MIEKECMLLFGMIYICRVFYKIRNTIQSMYSNLLSLNIEKDNVIVDNKVNNLLITVNIANINPILLKRIFLGSVCVNKVLKK